jgi:hypothetical protein
MTTQLNPKHELMAYGLANGMTQEAAYVAAGYSQGGARQCSTRLLQTNSQIRIRVSRVTQLITEWEQMGVVAQIQATERLSVSIVIS